MNPSKFDISATKPSKELVAESTKQLRNILGLLFSTCLIWLVTGDAVKGSLQVRERAKHLAAWLVVRDLFASNISDLSSNTETEPVKCFVRMVPVQSGSEIERCDNFAIASPWHAEARIFIQLQRIPDTTAFRVLSDTSALPVQKYAVATVNKRLEVIPLQHASSERTVFNAAERDGTASPEGWATTMSHLFARGWIGHSQHDLRLNDPQVAAFIRDGFSASYTVSGVPFSPGVFPAAVAAFIGTLSFLLWGPLSILLRADKAPENDPWVLLSKRSGFKGGVLASAQIGLALVVAALPLAVLITQVGLLPYMTRPEILVWVPFSLGLLLGSATIAWASAAIGRLRHNADPQ